MAADLSLHDRRTYTAEIFKDGINADKDPTDSKRETIEVTNNDKLEENMANGEWLCKPN